MVVWKGATMTHLAKIRTIVDRGRILVLLIILPLVLGACASFEAHNERAGTETSSLSGSYVELDLAESNDGSEEAGVTSPLGDGETETQPRFQALQVLPEGDGTVFKAAQFVNTLSAEPSLQLKADDMPITEFIHYALGELLGIE